ncbi:MAG: hypothetical protein A2838_00905 [Candidatus Zambryskibacteria bacterium RIFCSPHIGHO2_01_FULL_46_25]|uniref:Glycosyltransferase n=2 Tax=Parcubacteria group TaxID=1794811 RepID=A0A0G1KBS9_9BACT|nr:MAG: hypothetical protein UW78_C0014G0006 [Candidatus Azambacteria bacterium GW2011_GWA1_44_9]OHA90520.1 MAG: hypothetical protein A2838_00905 [Candidatus Zambryskibacteria bacterium RIFCSPHIGHO2_01_FULL_46_25]
MKLLILTQKVAKNDPILGFFVNWIKAFSEKFEKITVICLEAGEYDLPGNVKVLSLGEEKLKIENSKLKILAKLKYAWNFYKYIFKFRHDYDAVFVHMNQEYVILGWKFWKLWGKKIYLWRNHAHGDFFTRLAILVSDKVFYTSSQSFTAKFGKAVRMPAGIDTDFFKPDPSVARIPNSVLFLGRIAPVKKVMEFVEWAETKGFRKVTIAGPIGDKEYGEKVLSMLTPNMTYVGPVTQAAALKLYQTHETYVNMTPAGSFDKTILEVAACGTRVKVENNDLKFMEGKTDAELRDFVVENHSLKKLADKLAV